MSEGTQYEDASSADVYTAADSHGAAPSVRLLRGRVIVRELDPTSSIWMPVQTARNVRTHRGVVLGMGPPAVQEFVVDGVSRLVDVPHGFKVGDVVQYHFEHHQEAWTQVWPPDGKLATLIAQEFVDAVVED